MSDNVEATLKRFPAFNPGLVWLHHCLRHLVACDCGPIDLDPSIGEAIAIVVRLKRQINLGADDA